MSEAKSDYEMLARIEKLEYLLGLVKGGSSPINVLSAPFTLVNNSTPYTGGSASKFRCDASAGPCAIQLGSFANLGIIIVTSINGPNPIVITPASGTIWDPSRSAFESTATLSNGSGSSTGWWQWNLATTQWIEIV
jgi:hypothetical protein